MESTRLTSNEEIEELRQELVSTRAENELNLQRIDKFQTTHQTMQRTYDELIERYTTLQQSFEDLQQASTVKARTEEKSTDALLDGTTIDRICDLNATIEVCKNLRFSLKFFRKCLSHLQKLVTN